ncbi:MAG: hypothetical protein IJ718_01840 [Paludibacteraceae bacterium]|nr:hypothetical protein [Paludibacteraceae bacterium]
MANSICKRCKFYDTCDEDNLMRSYVTAANRDGCPHYGMMETYADVEERQEQMWAERAEEERQRRQKKFDAEIGEKQAKAEAALERVDGELDRIAANAGISRFPTENMHEMMYGVGYMQWQQIRAKIEPFDDNAIVAYNDFLDRYEELDHELEHKDPRAPYKLYMEKIDEILQAYRDFGLTGAGSQREEIRKQAEQWQQAIDKKKEEEKRKAEEARQQKAEEARKEQERLEEEKRQKRAFWKPLIIAAIVVFVIGLIIPPIMGIGLLGVGIAGVVRYFRLKNKQNN